MGFSECFRIFYHLLPFFANVLFGKFAFTEGIWNDLSSYPTRYAICEATGQYITGTKQGRILNWASFNYLFMLGYDPRCRIWFTGANNDVGTAVFTSPCISPSTYTFSLYPFPSPLLLNVDITSTASKDLVVAVARTLDLDSGGVYGVVALNFKVAALENSILSTKFLETGYLNIRDSRTLSNFSLYLDMPM